MFRYHQLLHFAYSPIRTVFTARNPRQQTFLLRSSIVQQCRAMTAASPHIKQVYGDITKSPGDKRLYRGLELTNGLKVLLVSDETTDKSSAAMDVHVGSMSDPWELPGLAHFCEHMLFLGTEKYPQENEYSKYLSENGGSSNAFTSGEHTNYYFDIAPDHLQGALDRFAQFFLCPLFTASATEREVNAVNSENDKNLQNDSWRLFQLEKSTANNKHDYSKFGTGNKDTLDTIPKQNGLNVRDELLKFHKKYYSSNIMALSILGKESLDELSDLVVNLFHQVENKDVAVPDWPEHPYGEEQLKQRGLVVPVKDIRNLSVMWPIPDQHPFYKSNPGHYLGHLIGHEGPGSLLSELKARGWVNTLIGGQKDGANGFAFMIVNVDLTEVGIDHTDEIVTLIFQYLNLLKQDGPKEWIMKECQDLNAMTFRFKDKEKPRNYTCHVAGILHDYPMTEVLSAGYLLTEYDPQLITNILDKLTPENIRVAVIGKKFDGQTDCSEKWYDTQYKMEPIPEALLKQWETAGLNEKLKLPPLNEFIPTNFDLVQREEEGSALPMVIQDTPASRVWFKQDDKFLLPKSCISIELTSSIAYMDPLHTNMTYMFVQLFMDALNEYAYAAELAGLNYSLNSTMYGMYLSLKGYSDKMHVLLQKILMKMTSFEIDPKRFEIIKESYGRALRNFRAEQPHQHAIYYTTILTTELMWTKEELLDAVNDLSLPRLQIFIPQLLSRLYMECLVYGNVTKTGALEVASIVEGTLKEKMQTKPLLPSQMRRFREVQLPDGGCYLYRKCNEVHSSSALEIYYQCFMQETHNNVLLELFCQIISEPCFDILRTQEQLGYIAVSGVRRSNGVQGLRVIVQSDKSPAYVEKRVEAFLHKMESHIGDMSEEVFNKHVAALAAKRLELPKKLTSQNMKFWSEIVCQQYNFDRDNVEVAHLKTLTKEDIMTFYKEKLAPDAPKRHKVSCQVYPQTEQGGAESVSSDVIDGLHPTPTLQQPIEVENLNEFKRELGLFPLPKPFINPSQAAKSKL